MLTKFLSLLLSISVIFLLGACNSSTQPSPSEHMESEAFLSEASSGAEIEVLPEFSEMPSQVQASPEPENSSHTVYAYVGEEQLVILLEDNSSAEAFADLLESGDLTIDMHDYGGFEKVGTITTTLPTNDEQIATEPGDVILYQGNSITLYYGENSWNFTRLGKIENRSQAELVSILGAEGVTVRFSLQ